MTRRCSHPVRTLRNCRVVICESCKKISLDFGYSWKEKGNTEYIVDYQL